MQADSPSPTSPSLLTRRAEMMRMAQRIHELGASKGDLKARPEFVPMFLPMHLSDAHQVGDSVSRKPVDLLRRYGI